MNNILVTGARGLVGSNLVKTLLSITDDKIVCMHTGSLNKTRLQYQGITDDNIVWVQGILQDKDFVERTINNYEITDVYHLAAVSVVRKASRNPIVCFDTNVRGTWNLLEACRTSGTVNRFIGMSSDKAYGEHSELPYKEDFALKAVNTYDASKAMEDILIRTYAYNYGLNAVVARACNIYGPGDFNYSRIIPNSIRRILDGERPIIWKGVNDYIREFVYVQEVVVALIHMCGASVKYRGEAFNIATGDIWSVERMVNEIADIMHSDLRAEIIEKELTFKEIPKQYLDGAKLKEALNVKPGMVFSIRDKGMAKTIDWYTKVFENGVK